MSEHTKRHESNKRTWDHRFKLRNVARSSSLSWFCVYAGHEQSRLASRRTDVRQIRGVQRLPWCHSVCVWTIWIDVKLLFFFSLQRQGDHPCTVSDGPTKRPQYMRISRLMTVTYLLFSCHFFHVTFLQWDVANPRTTMPFPNNLFSTCPGGNDLVQMEMLHLAVALKYFPRDPSRICSSTFSCQV